MTLKIEARPKGPLVVTLDGPLELVGLDGAPIDVSDRKRVMLCRCGASSSKPLCDGAHNRIGFECPPPRDEEDDPAAP